MTPPTRRPDPSVTGPEAGCCLRTKTTPSKEPHSGLTSSPLCRHKGHEAARRLISRRHLAPRQSRWKLVVQRDTSRQQRPKSWWEARPDTLKENTKTFQRRSPHQIFALDNKTTLLVPRGPAWVPPVALRPVTEGHCVLTQSFAAKPRAAHLDNCQ